MHPLFHTYLTPFMQTTSKKDKRTLDTELARLELKVSQLTEENASLQQVCIWMTKLPNFQCIFVWGWVSVYVR